MKGNILQGTARGRMGEIVAKVVFGEQILSKYQPNVSNPNSPKQLEVRQSFTEASKMMKKIRKDLLSLGITPLYNLYSGASKSLQNILFPYYFRFEKIVKVDGNSMYLNSKMPTLNPGYTGNVFELVKNDVNLELTSSGVEIGDMFFGSDVEIAGNQLIGLSVFTGINGSFPNYSVNKPDIALTLLDRTDLIGVPKGYGFKNDKDDVGEWPYVYKIGQPLIINDGMVSIPFQGLKKQYSAWTVLYDAQGGIFYSGSINGLVTTP